jgi:hypothetical protein
MPGKGCHARRAMFQFDPMASVLSRDPIKTKITLLAIL